MLIFVFFFREASQSMELWKWLVPQATIKTPRIITRADYVEREGLARTESRAVFAPLELIVTLRAQHQMVRNENKENII